MEKLKAIFFDMDGVLYDSMPNHEYTWCNSFATEGITFEPQDAYINEGRTGRGTINLVFNKIYGRNATDEEVDRIYGLKTRLMAQCPVAPPMPRMKEFIDYLRAEGIKTYVVTGSKQPTLMEKLNSDYGFVREEIVSGADVKMGKPDPEPYLIALQRSGCEAKECAVVENAPLGVRSAKAAGLYTIAVNTGKLTDEILLNEGCDSLYASTSDMVAAIKK
jgi:HAD superfamily hydrolase (TIGR01509 family)